MGIFWAKFNEFLQNLTEKNKKIWLWKILRGEGHGPPAPPPCIAVPGYILRARKWMQCGLLRNWIFRRRDWAVGIRDIFLAIKISQDIIDIKFSRKLFGDSSVRNLRGDRLQYISSIYEFILKTPIDTIFSFW